MSTLSLVVLSPLDNKSKARATPNLPAGALDVSEEIVKLFAQLRLSNRQRCQKWNHGLSCDPFHLCNAIQCPRTKCSRIEFVFAYR